MAEAMNALSLKNMTGLQKQKILIYHDSNQKNLQKCSLTKTFHLLDLCFLKHSGIENDEWGRMDK